MATEFETIGYNSAYMRDISKILVSLSQGVFGVGLLNNVSQILPQPTLVAMATKFELKLAITRPICEISSRFLRLTGGFRVGLFNDVSQLLPRLTLVAMSPKFGSKLAITQLV